MSSLKIKSSGPAWIPGEVDPREHLRESPLDLVLRNPVSGLVVDISVSGLGIEASSSLVPLSKQKFTLGIGEARATVLGEVRWCKLATTAKNADGDRAPVYRAGVALLEPIVLS